MRSDGVGPGDTGWAYQSGGVGEVSLDRALRVTAGDEDQKAMRAARREVRV